MRVLPLIVGLVSTFALLSSIVNIAMAHGDVLRHTRRDTPDAPPAIPYQLFGAADDFEKAYSRPYGYPPISPSSSAAESTTVTTSLETSVQTSRAP